ncbi:MAG: sirohydrochlorin cobaltochelatase [Atopobiaceae bacterium]
MTCEGLVFASYGTLVDEARTSDIAPVAEALKSAFAEDAFAEAYTSAWVREHLVKRGIASTSLEEALTSLADEGVARATVQPGLIVCGDAWDKLAAEAAALAGRFPEGLLLGRPLLADDADQKEAAEVIAEVFPVHPSHAFVLVGHGTRGTADAAYAGVVAALHAAGRTDFVLGLMEGSPDPDEVEKKLVRNGTHSATIVPLMLTAGSHVRRQLAGEGAASWTSRLNAAGLATDCTLAGLGSLPGMGTIFVRHAREAEILS